MITPRPAVETIGIGDLVIDCAVTEGHSFRSEISSFPTEDGSEVTDHVRVLPDMVTLEGLVSDTPLGGDLVTRREIASDLPSVDILAELKLIREKREPVTITTSLGVYTNMVMTGLDVPRDAATGESLKFTAIFQQIIVVTLKRTVTVTEPRSKKKRGYGYRLSPIQEQMLQDTVLGGLDPADEHALASAREQQLEDLLNSPLSNEELERLGALPEGPASP